MARLLYLEPLESRQMLSALWHNASFPCDVDATGRVVPLDALIVINDLNQFGSRTIGNEPPSARAAIDISNDGIISPLDALIVINLLNKYSGSLEVVSSIVNSDPDGNGTVLTSQVTISGVTNPDIRLSAIIGDALVAIAQSDDTGRFEFTVVIEQGESEIRLDILDPLGRTKSDTILVHRGDIVHNWNASILSVVRAWTTTSNDPYQNRIVPSPPPVVARNLAMIHAALFDAVNAIEGRYHPYLLNLPTAPAGVSKIAAAASAAHTVASALYSDADERAIWDATLDESLTSEPDIQARNLGIAYGKTIGQAMLSNRMNDGSKSTVAFIPGDEPGEWNRTYPDFLPPMLPQWPGVKPFAIESILDFRPEPPPELTSQAYAVAVDEAMRLGALQSTERTPEQTEIALFWADGGGTATPPGHWNRIAAEVSMTNALSLIESARLFAILNLAMADAGIASWDAKYAYEMWRPIDAIRDAGIDGNPATNFDATWLPLLKTPPFPSYTSGHSTFSGAAAAVLTAILGDNISFDCTIDPQDAPSQRPLAEDNIFTRQFTSFRQAAEEAGISRIYGGIHFRFDNTAGLEIGNAIGEFVVSNRLKNK